MKINFLKLALTAVLSISIYSCREEIVYQNSAENQVEITDGIVKNGRLYFPNKASLTHAYDKLKDKEDEVIADYVDAKDIISLRPIVTEKNEAIIGEKLKKRINRLKSNKRYMASASALSKIENESVIADDIDDLEEIIGDDAYGAFLDSRAEIQVADKIYKYTDVGLFIVTDSRYDGLMEYLAVNEISDDLMYATDSIVRSAYIETKPSGQAVVINDYIQYYNGRRARNQDNVYNPPINPPYYPPVTDPNTQMANFINSMQNCDTYTTILQDLFGESDMCVDHYEDRRRVKTKAYNNDYYLVYSLGVKVKHQYKGWTGLWRKENTDELRLGVIFSQFTYDYSNNFQFSTSPYNITTIYNNNSRYMFDATTYWSQNGLQITGYSIQNFPSIIKDNIVIEQFGGLGTYGQAVNAAIAAGNKQLTTSKLNEYFWKFLIPKLGDWWTNMGKARPDANDITLVYKTPPTIPGKVEIVKTFYKHAYNVEDLSKTFDWGFQIGFNVDTSSGQVSPTANPGALKKPQNFKVTMYGVAKRNGQWHGSKINTANQ